MHEGDWEKDADWILSKCFSRFAAKLGYSMERRKAQFYQI